MSKVRILRLITRMNVGGPAHHVLVLTKGLEERGYETLLIAGKEAPGERRALPWIEKSGVPVQYLPIEREPSLIKDVHMVLYLRRIMREWKPHILHTHTAKAGAVGRLAAWLAGVPIRIHTYHGHSFEGYFSRWRSQLYRWIERMLGWITHRIVAISETQQKELVEKFQIAPARKVSVIRLGFPLERLMEYDAQKVQQLRQEWGGDKGVYLIGWIGRMVPIKRIDRLLETLASLRPYAPPFRLIMIGDGPEYNRMRRLSEKLKMDSLITWTGIRWDIPEVLRALDGVVLTSDNEGTPVVLIEALACGTPVAATPVGGVPDLLEGGKWGVLLHEPLRNSLLNFLRNLPAAREVARQASEYIFKNYNHRRLLEEIDQLYRTELARKKIPLP